MLISEVLQFLSSMSHPSCLSTPYLWIHQTKKEDGVLRFTTEKELYGTGQKDDIMSQLMFSLVYTVFSMYIKQIFYTSESQSI